MSSMSRSQNPESASKFQYQKYRLTSNGLLTQDDESNVLYSDVLSEVNRLFSKSKLSESQKNSQDGTFELINQNKFTDATTGAEVLVQLFRDKNGRHKKIVTSEKIYEKGEQVDMNVRMPNVAGSFGGGMSFKTNSVEEIKRNCDLGINVKGLSFYETNIQPTYIYSITTHAEPEPNNAYFESKDIKSPLLNKLSGVVPPGASSGFGVGLGGINTENNIASTLNLMNKHAMEQFGKNAKTKNMKSNAEISQVLVPGPRQSNSGNVKHYGGVRENQEFPASNNNAVFNSTSTNDDSKVSRGRTNNININNVNNVNNNSNNMPVRRSKNTVYTSTASNKKK